MDMASMMATLLCSVILPTRTGKRAGRGRGSPGGPGAERLGGRGGQARVYPGA